METKICPFPECINSGEPQPIEKFKDGRGRDTTGCLDCRKAGRGRHLKGATARLHKNKKEPYRAETIEPWQVARLNRRIIEITRGIG